MFPITKFNIYQNLPFTNFKNLFKSKNKQEKISANESTYFEIKLDQNQQKLLSTKEIPLEEPKSFLDEIEALQNYKTSHFYQLGIHHGKVLGNHQHAESYIKGYFNAKKNSEQLYKQGVQGKVNEAKRKLCDLEKDIQKLNFELDESDSNSIAFQLHKERTLAYEKIEQQQRANHQDKFVESYWAAIDKLRQQDVNHADKMKKQGKQAAKEVGEFAQEMKSQLLQSLNNFKNLEEIPQEKKKAFFKEKLQNIDWINNFAQKSIRQLMDIRRQQYRMTDDSQSRENLVKVIKDIKHLAILIPSRTRIITSLLFFLTIVLGEVFLVAKFTSESLGVNYGDALSGVPVFDSFLRFALFIFCIAYPLAIGMLTKFWLTKYKLKEQPWLRLSSWVGFIVLLMVISLSILNAALLNLDPQSLTLSLSGNIQESPNTFFNQLLQTTAFFGITTLFAVVAGMLFVDFIDSYEFFKNTKKKRLFSTSKENDIILQCKEQIARCNQEVEDRQNNLQAKRDQAVALQPILAFAPEKWNWKETLESLKNSALGLYHYGYHHGQQEYIGKMTLEQVIERYQKQRGINAIIKSLNSDKK